MKLQDTQITNYLTFCKTQKCLDENNPRLQNRPHTIFFLYVCWNLFIRYHFQTIGSLYCTPPFHLQTQNLQKKNRIAQSIFHYCEFYEFIEKNPFDKIQIRFREPIILPKTIPLQTLELFLSTIYTQRQLATTPYQQKRHCVTPLSLNCFLPPESAFPNCAVWNPRDVNLNDNFVLIYGKGSKERKLQIGNANVLKTLNEYKNTFSTEIESCDHFFANQTGKPLSDQSVRRMIQKYAALAGIEQHMTPHMFRHTFASSPLDADVDIRYIQEMLGHSSITTTQIYTHVTLAKQKMILTTKHPRNGFCI